MRTGTSPAPSWSPMSGQEDLQTGNTHLELEFLNEAMDRRLLSSVRFKLMAPECGPHAAEALTHPVATLRRVGTGAGLTASARHTDAANMRPNIVPTSETPVQEA